MTKNALTTRIAAMSRRDLIRLSLELATNLTDAGTTVAMAVAEELERRMTPADFRTHCARLEQMLDATPEQVAA